jgi:hypothetical protein
MVYTASNHRCTIEGAAFIEPTEPAWLMTRWFVPIFFFMNISVIPFIWIAWALSGSGVIPPSGILTVHVLALFGILSALFVLLTVRRPLALISTGAGQARLIKAPSGAPIFAIIHGVTIRPINYARIQGPKSIREELPQHALWLHAKLKFRQRWILLNMDSDRDALMQQAAGLNLPQLNDSLKVPKIKYVHVNSL